MANLASSMGLTEAQAPEQPREAPRAMLVHFMMLSMSGELQITETVRSGALS
jgi:hypothetical protein